MTNLKWFVKEHESIQKAEEALEKRKINFKKTVFSRADKMEKEKGESETKFFQVPISKKIFLRFSKIASNTVSVKVDKFRKVFGKKADKMSDKRATFSEPDFLEAEGKIPASVKKLLDKFITVGMVPSKQKLDEAFHSGEVSEKDLRRVVAVETTYKLKVNKLKVSEEEK